MMVKSIFYIKVYSYTTRILKISYTRILSIQILSDLSLYKDEQGRSEEIQVRNPTQALEIRPNRKYITMINTGDSTAMEKMA